MKDNSFDLERRNNPKMDISIKLTEDHFVPSSKRIPIEYIVCNELDFDSYVLGKGTDSKEGKEAILTGLAYTINKKSYPLEGWGLKAIVTDNGMICPLVRRAKGEERYAFQRVIHESHCLACKEGDLNDWWPTVVGMLLNEQVKAIEFTENILTVVNELEDQGKAIEEDMLLEENIEE
jgi:hypothetical protein